MAKILNPNNAPYSPAGEALAMRWETQYDMSKCPFDAMWCRLPAAATSPEDCHPESELLTVLSGELDLKMEDSVHRLGAGNSIWIPSNQPHVLSNPSNSAESLALSIYW